MRRLTSLVLFLFVSGCSYAVQNTSGRDYVLASQPGMIDPEIAEIAAVEPNLQFPARIGVARIVNGQLTLPPAAEVALFTDLTSDRQRYGTFTPVSPLVVALVADPAQERRAYYRDASDVINELRRAAARQHLDYVIVYEVGARSSTRNTPFALADVTLLGGMLLPTREIDVAGLGTAMFMDVRNGYPYGTAQVTTDLTGFARTFQADIRGDELRDAATAQVAAALIPEIAAMLAELADQ